MYHDAIFDNNTLVVEMVAQLSQTVLPGSLHSILVTVDYGMDGVDYLNNVSFNATAPDPSVFNAVSCLTTRCSINVLKCEDDLLTMLLTTKSQIDKLM